MLKLLSLSFLIIFFSSCGVDTASSVPNVPKESNEETVPKPIIIDSIVIETIDGLSDLDLINKNPIGTDLDNPDLLDPNKIDDQGLLDPNGIDDNVTTPPDDNTTVPDDDVPNDGSISDYDTEGAIEDPFACIIGDSNNGYTNNTVSDTSIDNRGIMDEEDGVGINSAMPYNDDISKTKVIVFYYDLKPARTMEVISTYGINYRVDVDTGWASNDETVLYVQTPKDQNDLYGCYRYELNSIDVNSALASVKVYRNKI